MSDVTNILLSFSVLEELEGGWDSDGAPVVMSAINRWLVEAGHQPFGREVDETAGGEKALEVWVYVAAFHALIVDDFVDMLRGLPWIEPQHVQVFVLKQADECWQMIPL